MTRAQGKRFGGRIARDRTGKPKARPRAPNAAPERDEPDLQRAEQFFGAIGTRIEEGGDTAIFLISDQGPHPDAPVRLVRPRHLSVESSVIP